MRATLGVMPGSHAWEKIWGADAHCLEDVSPTQTSLHLNRVGQRFLYHTLGLLLDISSLLDSVNLTRVGVDLR
jgi:hypothetical protein